MKRMKSVSFLVVTVLVIMAFIRGKYSQWFMIGAVVIWLAMICSGYIFRWIKALLRKIKKVFLAVWKESEERMPKEKKIYNFDLGADSDRLLMLHVIRRITDKMKSMWPNAAWDWEDQNAALEAIKHCGTARINTQNIPTFDMLEVKFDEQANIKYLPMKFIPFKMEEQERPASWFSAEGQEYLTKIISELHAKGYVGLTIYKGGQISAGGNIINSLVHFPNKNKWTQLVSEMEKELGVIAKVNKDNIEVSWR